MITLSRHTLGKNFSHGFMVLLAALMHLVCFFNILISCLVVAFEALLATAANG